MSEVKTNEPVKQEGDFKIKSKPTKPKQLDVQTIQQTEGAIEDRKDKRSKMEATQQSELISQRKNDGLPIDFENKPEQGMQAFM